MYQVQFSDITIPNDMSLHQAVEVYDRYIANLTLLESAQLLAGNEGFFQSIVDGISDTFFRIFGNIKSMLKLTLDFKRSELMYYGEAHHSILTRILRLEYNDIRHIQVPIPAGMVGTYSQAITAVADCLLSLDMATRSKAAQQWVRSLLVALASQSESNLRANINAGSTFASPEIDRTFVALNKVLTDQVTHTVALNKVYGSMEEFRLVHKRLLELEVYLKGVAHVFKQMTLIQADVDNIIAEVKAKEIGQFSVQVIKELAQAIRMLAVLFERYGLVIRDLDRLIHNEVEVFQAIQRKLKL